MTTLPAAGQRQQRCPTGGQDDCGTAEDGTTLAVRLALFDEEDFDVVLYFSRWPTSMVYGGEIPFSRASSLTLVPVWREILYSVSPRFTV
jgi:hypothetical protein